MLSVRGGRDGSRSGREDVEERISLGALLDAAVRTKCLPQEPIVLHQHVGVAFAQLLEKPRRSLNVGEQECQGIYAESVGDEPSGCADQMVRLFDTGEVASVPANRALGSSAAGSPTQIASPNVDWPRRTGTQIDGSVLVLLADSVRGR